MTRSALDALARLRGLGEAYYDCDGKLRAFSAQARSAVLTAMGLDVHDEASLAVAEQRQAAVSWAQLLAPVYVVTQGGILHLEVHLPEQSGIRRVDWMLICEDGQERHGSAAIDDLETIATATVGEHRFSRLRMPLCDDLPLGYHELSVSLDDGRIESTSLIVTPQRCHEPHALEGAARLWGLTVQVYTLRSQNNWGMGDFGDLLELIDAAAPLGCSVIGLNPLHALVPADPAQSSPYSPSSRQFLNVLYIAVPRVPEYAECVEAQSYVADPAVQSQLEALRSTVNVDYAGVARHKLAVLRLLHAQFQSWHLEADSDRGRTFLTYLQQRGESLQRHALFDALDAHFRNLDPAYWGWPSWPEEYRDPTSETVQRFAKAHATEVEFHLYLQWLAEEQLAIAQAAARTHGMGIGLYGDVAVGVSPGGSETWSNRRLYVAGAGVGAPPDPLALKGQDWGIPPQDPTELRTQAYVPFITLLRNNMGQVGALRLDHVMSLFRLWWVPRGHIATDGVYVHYPLDDLMGILALESVRNRCLVIGEDLGTVPDEMRVAMERFGVCHYKVLLFEKERDGTFRVPSSYVRHALATVTTHDLPPLKSWWGGEDIELRDRLNLYPSAAVRDAVSAERAADRIALMHAVVRAGLWYWQPHEPVPDYSHALMRAIHLYLGMSFAALAVVQIEDLIGMEDPVNVPGTSTEHPNWQRKITAGIADIFAREEVREMLMSLGRARRGENPNI